MGIFISMYIAMPVVVLFSLLFPKDKRNGFICIGCFLILWLIQALRDVSIGIDLESYIPFFENSPSRGVFDYYNNNFEKGYQLFNSLIAIYLTDNPNVFLAIVSTCTLIPVSVIFYRYSRNVFISFTVYSALILYHFSFSGLRQALAIGIIVISYYFIVDRKPLWFTISVILAMFFHSSAVFFIVAYPLCNWIKMSNKQYLFIAIIAIVCLFFLRPLAESLMLVFFPEGRYAGYLSHEVTMSYNFMILLLVVFLMTFLARGINIERYRILLQNGDSYFMLELALDIKRQTKAKLMVFNTEGYYLFKHNYYSADTGFWNKSLFKIYKRLYNGWFRKLMKNVSYSIYGNELLKADCDIAFNTDKSDVIYTSSELVFDRAKFENKIPTFSYLGNLGLDRHKSLIEIGEMLQFINCNYYLDVYGQSPNNEIRDCLLSSKGIRFQGLVEYEKVKEIIRKSDILFHVENQANKWLVELKYAFSAKIADSIASGKLFILYASDSIACAKYILDSKAGAYVRNKDELIEVLTTVISVKAYRDKILDNAEKVALENHNKDNNSKRMHALVCNVVLNS